MIELRLLQAGELEEYFNQMYEQYHAELLQGGHSIEYADRAVQDTRSETFVDGELLPGNYIFRALDGNSAVGNLWIHNNEADDSGDWVIYDIETFADKRGQGFGRKILEAAEKFVKENGGTEIRLNVAGFNTVARNLYESSGYETTRLSMKKSLS